jgi:hypothetical protein
MKGIRFSYLFIGVVCLGIAIGIFFLAIIPGFATMLWLIVLIFGFVGVGSLYAFALNIVTVIKTSRITQFGANGTGIYLDHKKKVKENNVSFYSIRFTFKNDYGKYVETKTECSYRRYEAEALAAMKSFPVKYLDEQAVIMVDKDVLLQTYHQNFEEKVVKKIKTITDIN